MIRRGAWSRRALLALLALAAVAMGGAPERLEAQGAAAPVDRSSAGRLAASCGSGGSAALAASCAEAALGAVALTEGVSLLVGAGGALPVSPSTAGHRMEGTPRVVVDAGVNLARIRHLDLSATPGTLRETHSTLVAGRLTATAGIFDGFRPVATVGGVGAVDGVVSLRLARLPDGPGDQARTAVAWGGGVRLGVVRESFTLPGITVTGLHHRLGTIRHGQLPSGGSQLILSPHVTSVRLEVGKDLLAFGLTGGAALERVGGRTRIRAPGEAGEVGEAARADLGRTRPTFFAGANYTWLVTQVAGEVTWAPGRSFSDDLLPLDVFPLDRGQLQVTLTFRLIY